MLLHYRFKDNLFGAVILYLLENLLDFSVKSNGCGCAARIGVRGSVGEKRNATE